MLERRFLILALLSFVCLGTSKAPSFSIETIKDLLRRNLIKDVPDLLSRLPEDYRSNYTLAYKSLSLHESSLEYPRAILFGKDARLIVTFNGHPSQQGYNDVEMLEFNETRQEFEFYALHFGEKVELSEPNPPICVTCHTASPRPIWNDYPQWSGIFGSDDDSFSDPVELNAFIDWRMKTEKHDRYKFLLNLPLSDLYPYLSEHSIREYRIRPNARLGDLLAILNAKKISNLILKNPNFFKFRNSLLFVSLGCSLRLDPEDKKSLWQRSQKIAEEYFDPKDYRLLHRDIVKMASFDYTMQRMISDINLIDWTLNMMGQELGMFFNTGIFTQAQLVAARLMAVQVSNDPELAVFYRPISIGERYDRLIYDGAGRDLLYPGGVLATFDHIGQFIDVDLARNACPLLYERTKKEMGLLQ